MERPTRPGDHHDDATSSPPSPEHAAPDTPADEEPGVIAEASAGYAPADMIAVARDTIEQLQSHLVYVYERFPTRRLKQGILITRHLLRGVRGRSR